MKCSNCNNTYGNFWLILVYSVDVGCGCCDYRLILNTFYYIIYIIITQQSSDIYHRATTE